MLVKYPTFPRLGQDAKTQGSREELNQSNQRLSIYKSNRSYIFQRYDYTFCNVYSFHSPIIVGGRLPVRTLLIRWASALQSVQRIERLAKVTSGSVRLHRQQGVCFTTFVCARFQAAYSVGFIC